MRLKLKEIKALPVAIVVPLPGDISLRGFFQAISAQSLRPLFLPVEPERLVEGIVPGKNAIEVLEVFRAPDWGGYG